MYYVVCACCVCVCRLVYGIVVYSIDTHTRIYSELVCVCVSEEGGGKVVGVVIRTEGRFGRLSEVGEDWVAEEKEGEGGEGWDPS